MTGRADRLSMVHDYARRFGLPAIVAVFVALSFVYSVINPIFEAPDELWHFLNVKYIQDNKALIVQSGSGLDNPARQEGGQPPLYYLLSAGLVSWISTGPIDDVAILNFHGQPGNVDSKLNKNVVVHSDDEGFPYHGVSLAVHLLRVFSILLSACTVVVTYLIAKEIFPESLAISLGAAAFNAFIPQFVFIGSSINNDNLVTLLASLVTLQLVRLCKVDIGNRGYLLLGLLVGLVSLTKISGLGLVPLALVVVLALSVHRRSVGIALKGTFSALGGVILVSGWWYVRNWLLYADPLGLSVFLRAVNRADTKSQTDQWVANLSTLSNSFWALFGWSNIAVDSYIYWLFDIVLVLGVVGAVYGGLVVLKSRNDSHPGRFLLLVPAVWIVILLIALEGWTSSVGYDVGRLLFPAISGISLFIVLGITRILGRRISSSVLGVLVVAMLVIVAAGPILYIRPAYKHGVQFVSGQRSLTLPLNATFGDKFRLLGYELSKDAVTPGQSVNVMLYWEPMTTVDEGLYQVGLDLVTQDRQKSLSPVSDGLADSSMVRKLKKTGWLLRDTYEVKIPPDAELYTHLPIVVRIERPQSGFLDAYDGAMTPIGHDVVVARIRVDDAN